MFLDKRLVPLTVILIVVVTNFCIPARGDEPTFPTVNKTSFFRDSLGWGHVFGEVTNPPGTGSGNRVIQIGAAFFAGSTAIATVQTVTMLDLVKVGENAPFNAILADSTKAAQVTSWQFFITNFLPVVNTPFRLNVSQTLNFTDSDGNFHVRGSVQNNNSATATFIQVIGTFYNSTGAVAYADWTYLDAGIMNLTTTQSGSFEIVALNATRSLKITKTSLVAQSCEYSSAAVADFSLRALQRTQSVLQGGSVIYDVRFIPNSPTPPPTTTPTLTLSVIGLPQGSTASFSPPTLTNASKPNEINLTITTSSAFGVGVGNFLVNVRGLSLTSSRNVSFILTVNPTVDFALAISPPSSSISQGQTANYTIAATSGGGFSSPLTLNYSNLPTGSSASFDANPISFSGGVASTVLRISTNLSTVTVSGRVFTVCARGGSPQKSHCSSAAVTVTASTVQRFTLSIQPSERTVSPGNSTTFTVTVGSINSFNQQVQLAVTGNPAGTTATLDPTAVTPPPNGNAQSTLHVSATSTPLFGTYTLDVTGSRTGFTTQTANTTLIVSSFVAPDFAVYVLPTTLSVIQNNSGTATIQVVSINNFDGAVDLTLQNLPTGVTFSIANPTVAPFPGGYVNTKLTVQTSSSTPLGDYPMSLRGTSGGKTHSVNLGLTVTNKTTPFPFKCIIATATYGSEFTPEVQFLRGFRDNRILATTAGAEFMQVFNAWYYSFSPHVASWLARIPPARDVGRVFLAPLLAILHLSEISYVALAFTPEVAVTLAGVVASSLIGVIYFGPILAIALRRRALQPWRRVLMFIALAWCLSLLLLTLGLIASISPVVMAATSLLVLSTITLGACSVPITVSRLKPIFWKHV